MASLCLYFLPFHEPVQERKAPVFRQKQVGQEKGLGAEAWLPGGALARPCFILYPTPSYRTFIIVDVYCRHAVPSRQESGFLLGCGFNCGWSGLGSMQWGEGRTGLHS